ncbi:hypothetical protein TRAPUB_11805 [Trametes pubescens]|uniref:Uncharacterized protein n=1 Tax=Trametes pubescens TaxID=154538 RepID=A0A1M2VVN8_TRAPU|nr:hypothetical protein TRAPUB_11805 [Trametes pubescens]
MDDFNTRVLRILNLHGPRGGQCALHTLHPGSLLYPGPPARRKCISLFHLPYPVYHQDGSQDVPHHNAECRGPPSYETHRADVSAPPHTSHGVARTTLRIAFGGFLAIDKETSVDRAPRERTDGGAHTLRANTSLERRIREATARLQALNARIQAWRPIEDADSDADHRRPVCECSMVGAHVDSDPAGNGRGYRGGDRKRRGLRDLRVVLDDEVTLRRTELKELVAQEGERVLRTNATSVRWVVVYAVLTNVVVALMVAAVCRVL